jgi:hopanoid biosynthesis associated protein HpnK
MAPPVNSPAPRRWILNADDFGRSTEINDAVRRAHLDGVLTSASLMIAEPGAAEAVRIAKQLPQLGVGLHLTLADGFALTRGPLVDADGRFEGNAVRAGMRYFFDRSLRAALETELAAQLGAFHKTGLPLDHVNGHLNLHLHPVVFDILVENAARWGIHAMRLTRDPFRLNARLAGGAWLSRGAHAFIFRLLCARARPRLEARGIRFTPRVYGLLQYGRMDTAYWLKLIGQETSPLVEVYAHPSTTTFRHELDALLSAEVREAMTRGGIERVRYSQLSGGEEMINVQ